MNESPEHFEVSASQLSFWLHAQLDKTGLACNMTFSYKLYGELDPVKFEATIDYIVQRHEILRTNFKLVNGELRQFVHEGEKYDGFFAFQDVSRTAKEKSQSQQYFNNLKLDLAEDPLFQVRLFQQEEKMFVFTFVMHHILGDEWSLLILENELITVYNQLVNGETVQLLPLTGQYKDYAAWINKKLSEEDGKLKQYWQEKLADFQGNTGFTTDKPRSSGKTYLGSYISFEISNEMVVDFKKCCRSSGCTFFMGVVAILKLLIYRNTRTPFITLGVALSGRLKSEFENQIGNYLNAIPLITKIDEEMTFSSFMKKVRKTCLDGFKHQIYPFDKIVENLNLDKDGSRTPLFDVQVTWHTFGKDTESEELLSGIERVEVDRKLKAVLFDLLLIGHEEDGNFTFDYNSDLFERHTVDNIGQKMMQVMELVSQDPDQLIGFLVAQLADEEEVSEREEFIQSVAQSIDEDF